MTSTDTPTNLYLRLSDFREDDADSFPAREAKLRAEAKRRGLTVARVVIENDMAPTVFRCPRPHSSASGHPHPVRPG